MAVSVVDRWRRRLPARAACRIVAARAARCACDTDVERDVARARRRLCGRASSAAAHPVADERTANAPGHLGRQPADGARTLVRQRMVRGARARGARPRGCSHQTSRLADLDDRRGRARSLFFQPARVDRLPASARGKRAGVRRHGVGAWHREHGLCLTPARDRAIVRAGAPRVVAGARDGSSVQSREENHRHVELTPRPPSRHSWRADGDNCGGACPHGRHRRFRRRRANLWQPVRVGGRLHQSPRRWRDARADRRAERRETRIKERRGRPL